MSEQFTGGQLVVKVMEEFGAKVVFGVPGGQTLYVTDPIQDVPGMRFVHTRHENGAATAADGWGRLTGEPGICLATTGPGATNLITGLGGALRDSSPVIALVFQNRLADAGRGDAQESDHELLFGSICKKYIPVRDISVLPWAMREAYRTAKTGHPGPVVVDLYRDVIENQKAPYVPADPAGYCVRPDSVASDEAIEAAARVIRASKKPMLWIGNGVKLSHAADEVTRLSKQLCAPIVCTYNAMCAVDESFENFLGARSRHGTQVTQACIEEADCVILVGSSLTAISTNRWSIAPKNVVQFDILPEQIGRQYPVAAGVVGDAKASLQKLLAALEGFAGTPEFRDEMFSRKAAWKEALLSGPIADTERTPVPPIALQRELEKSLRENTVFCVDAGNPGAWTHYTTFPKGTAYMKPVNYGNMGFALGAALGCKEASPDREVVALIGDGSLGMTLGELESIAREKLAVTVLLVNDSAFGNIKQEELFKMGEGRYIGVEFPDYDYLSVAKAFGFDGCIVTKASQIPAAMEAARKSGGPYMIEVKLDGSFTVWPEAL
ncbi:MULTISPECIES: thiamine pyrophosphate-binding protein [Anaerotruncus]|uniref:thiamine pyrophosphate-binding protein n=1 Tax=Anaerotruncus TaxID=244127 RepID=UPI002082152E|nr:thiamine pyrophosphate-binding protein [Anaerotruncus massiliensis (ex Togo et al. 2019)]GKH47463.1 acetolactate synthase [Oscillospiraceae bacterium]